MRGVSRAWTESERIRSYRRQAGAIVWRLRPAKVRVALKRRWFELLLERTATRTAPGLLDLGSAPGGWTVPTGLIEPEWLCYCVGANADITFDLELIRRFGVTVRAVEPVESYVELTRERAAEEPRFTIRQAALAARDGPVRMQVTHEQVSHAVSSAGLYESEQYVLLPGRTLDSLMAEAGDTQVQLLKLDVEGAEYEIVPTLDLRSLGVEVFSVQLHHVGTVRQARRIIRMIRAQGYETVACRPAVKLTFARRELVA
jgi:FkbM family methyltransferase